MKTIMKYAFALPVLSLFAFCAKGADVKFVNICDSTSYIRTGDSSETALSLDIKIDYTMPYSGIIPENMLKLNDMLTQITGVNFDYEGLPAPSQMVMYEGGKWVAATSENSKDLLRRIHSNEDDLAFKLWSESPFIKPVYNDSERLSMLAGNYVYTGGAHGMYFDNCVNYSLKEGKFVYLNDIFPGIDSAAGKSKYDEILDRLLTAKAKKQITDNGGALLVDTVSVTSDFAFTKDGIVLRYQPYEIAPWSEGVVEIPLTYAEIASIVSQVR